MESVTDTFSQEGWGDAPASPMSPTRPPSVRKRQSMHIMDLETRLDQLVSEHRLVQDAKLKAEQALQDANSQIAAHSMTIQQATEAVQARDFQIREKDSEIGQIRAMVEMLQREVARLTEENE